MAIVNGFILFESKSSHFKPILKPHEILKTAVEIEGCLDAIFVEDGNGLLIENGPIVDREHELFHVDNGRRMSSFIQYERARKQGGFCKDFRKTQRITRLIY